MTQNPSKEALLADLLEYARHHVAPDALEQTLVFLEQYYAQVDVDDLQERSLSNLFGAALSIFQLAQARSPGLPLVRVYHPSEAEHGWQSTHTIAEIINDDMPFLVDSVAMEINRRDLKLHLIIHPQLRVKRDALGNLLAILPRDQVEAESMLESLIHVEMDREIDADVLPQIAQGLQSILQDVRYAVKDWRAMQGKLQDVLEQASHAPLAPAEITESREFLRWALDNHFTLLGYREYDLQQQEGRYFLKIVPGTGLGILRDENSHEPSIAEAPPQIDQILKNGELLLLTKANTRATVHRPGYLDYIGIKRFDALGHLVGEARVIGLYTSTVYSISPSEIPVVRQKINAVLQRAGFLPKSHMEKTLLSILESYPRDELFQTSTEDLFTITSGILRLQERQRTRLFMRRDVFGRFVSCFVFVPREKYNTELRLKIQNILMQTFQGSRCDFMPALSESVLARLHFLVRTPLGTHVDVDHRQLEAQIVLAMRRWQDDLVDALTLKFGEGVGNKLQRKYGAAFPASYQESYSAAQAVEDISMIEPLHAANTLAMQLYRPASALAGQLHFKLYKHGAPVTLSESLPMLEHMGVRVLDEHPHQIQPHGSAAVWLHDIGLQVLNGVEVDLESVRPLFQDLFACAWRGEVENDRFNHLALAAQLDWRQIVILRAYAKYFKQIGLAYSQSYIEDTLIAYPKLARKLVLLFAARFDTTLSANRALAVEALSNEVRSHLEQVSNLDQDKILRQYLECILATQRTNYYQNTPSGGYKSYLSFKLNPALVPHLPEPRPMFEIFVYSPRVEGVHLRGGKVARGGLRWSDRREDFRTEVLGLVKAQMVKNTVIVPVGSKGGFFVKNAPPASDREAFMQEGIACYKTFLRGLLDVTDNLVNGQVVPPPEVVRHDADDPYLVVAADKGTATFSDIANSISAEYGFWLGDAFASGGSVGYDHKKMGITARGAWESVKRHFRELGHDTQTQDFTVAGVGDMSGDVFGNGMLLSEHIQLVAAFDHRHIFLDPHPNASTSFKERQRLFALPRSSWDDYEKSLISEGGGVYPLSAKSITLTPQVKAVLGITSDQLTPNELKTAILKAPVDLLYNGGIGTYVKASFETHAQVGDRANDPIRIDGRDLRARVVAEGGNLGFTQNGRIEAAQQGVHLFTDAIDNSAGVDCSDHEVNIKIFVNTLMAQGTLSFEQRNQLLSAMTEEVGQLVLQDNYYQTQCLSVTARRGEQLLEGQGRLIRFLEKAKRLNRKIEFLPSEDQIKERLLAKKGLTAPENAVLMAYAKMWLFDALIASELPDDAYFLPALVHYFPRPLRQRFSSTMQQHPLRREIIATVIVNQLVNRVGATFVHRVQEETGASVAEVVRAYALVREIYGLPQLWAVIDALDTRAPDAVQGKMLIDITRFAQRATLWLLRKPQSGSMGEIIQRFSGGVKYVQEQLPVLLKLPHNSLIATVAHQWSEQQVPLAAAQQVASLELLLPALDLVEVAQEMGQNIERTTQVYFALDQLFDHDWLRRQIVALPTDSHWQALARAALRDDLAWRQRTLTAAVLKPVSSTLPVEQLLAHWQEQQRPLIQRAQRVLEDLRALGQADLAMLSVALRELRNLI